MYSGSRVWSRLKNIFIFIVLMNSFLIINITEMSSFYYISVILVLLLLYLVVNISPLKKEKLSRRLRIMISGYELIVDCSISAFIEIIFYVSQLIFKYLELDYRSLVINGLTAIAVLIVPLVNGILRMMFTSRDLGVINRILLLLLWWMPGANAVILKNSCRKVRYEYYLEQTKMLRNESRKENEVCKTRYPVVLVHGIFFRDWMFLNYWGRIPKELIRNGAEIFYGHQQSSNPAAKSAEELKDNILKIINETGCEKVNIIAHSKGGLDSRYAISCLGLSKYVASLTTINTPHRGCRYVDFLLDKIPMSIKRFVADKYNKTFIKLGDKNPDFLGGVTDLTAEKCNEFNKKVKDADGVLYQSITSKLKNIFSAPFPLNLGYLFAKAFDGENDGLVGVESAKWGNFLGILKTDHKGISHGDVVDLTRIDLKGYDVSECYVEILKKLKDRGF
ncbi:MAG: triacylglycerol lipase [Clostridium sp.]|nr:triacylglycerol lipase [Clostridium sp.]